MTDPLYPNSEQVACAWARVTLATTGVATTLPDDGTWPNHEFVQVTVTGGSPSAYVPVANAVISLDCWAHRPGSKRPPWGQAAQLAERIRMATYAHPAYGTTLTMPAGYHSARVLSVALAGEPRRIPSDPSAYARVQVPVQVWWTAVGVVV